MRARACVYADLQAHACVCVCVSVCFAVKRKHISGPSCSFVPLHLSIYSFSISGWYEIRGLLIWLPIELRHKCLRRGESFFSATIFDCNANDNYVGSPSHPLIFPPSQNKQLDSKIDPPGWALFMNTKHIISKRPA